MVTDHPVTIKENATVVQLHQRNQGDCLPSLPNEDGNATTQVRMTAEADETAGGIPRGTHRDNTAGSFVI